MKLRVSKAQSENKLHFLFSKKISYCQNHLFYNNSYSWRFKSGTFKSLKETLLLIK